MTLQSSSHPALSGADRMAAVTADFFLLVGRILLGWIFVRSGYGKIFDIPTYSNTFPVRGLHPWLAYIAVPAEFFGGIALLLGFATRYAAVVMIIFVLVASFSSHRYWDFTDAAQRRLQDSAFYKNMAIMGGMFFVFVTGAGGWSLDALLRKKN